MGKTLNTEELSTALSLSECTDGYWLWDKVVEMNLAIRAKSREEALLHALSYYQDRHKIMYSENRTMRKFIQDLKERAEEIGDDLF